jgi:hypothetical protein
VAYHDSLWVTVGAAAPVIALAAIVSISDIFGADERFWDGFRRYLDGADYSTQFMEEIGNMLLVQGRRAGRIGLGSRWIAIINVSLQLAMLAIALVSLADGSNAVSPIVPEIGIPLGVFLLLVSTTLTLVLRSRLRTIARLGGLRPANRAP